MFVYIGPPPQQPAMIQSKSMKTFWLKCTTQFVLALFLDIWMTSNLHLQGCL